MYELISKLNPANLSMFEETVLIASSYDDETILKSKQADSLSFRVAPFSKSSSLIRCLYSVTVSTDSSSSSERILRFPSIWGRSSDVLSL